LASQDGLCSTELGSNNPIQIEHYKISNLNLIFLCESAQRKYYSHQNMSVCLLSYPAPITAILPHTKPNSTITSAMLTDTIKSTPFEYGLYY
jgi:hypothetical protein